MALFLHILDSEVKNMSKGDYQYGSGDYFENYNEIIPNEKNTKTFNVEEVEIFKILFD